MKENLCVFSGPSITVMVSSLCFSA